MVHYLRHVARYAPAAETEPLAGLVQRAVPSDLDLQIDLHEVARAGIAERAKPLRRPCARGAKRSSRTTWTRRTERASRRAR
jgi:hypothetical protein